ncbi:hypothetical protein DJ84_07990 [Halorubrum ezzemoulense]|nr:hypothetical protein DJ84_07990 [Halorubrum ezzemoulense]
MRILCVAPWIYPDTKGGGDYHVHAMSRDQAAMGHDVTVFTTREDEIVFSGSTELRLGGLSKLFVRRTYSYV